MSQCVLCRLSSLHPRLAPLLPLLYPPSQLPLTTTPARSLGCSAAPGMQLATLRRDDFSLSLLFTFVLSSLALSNKNVSIFVVMFCLWDVDAQMYFDNYLITLFSNIKSLVGVE